MTGLTGLTGVEKDTDRKAREKRQETRGEL